MEIGLRLYLICTKNILLLIYIEVLLLRVNRCASWIKRPLFFHRAFIWSVKASWWEDLTLENLLSIWLVEGHTCFSAMRTQLYKSQAWAPVICTSCSLKCWLANWGAPTLGKRTDPIRHLYFLRLISESEFLGGEIYPQFSAFIFLLGENLGIGEGESKQTQKLLAKILVDVFWRLAVRLLLASAWDRHCFSYRQPERKLASALIYPAAQVSAAAWRW